MTDFNIHHIHGEQDEITPQYDEDDDLESLALVSRSLPRPSHPGTSDSMANIFQKLPHPITPPSLPTGSVSTRFMKSAIASNVPMIAVTGGLSYLGSHIVARHLEIGHFVRALIPQGANPNFLKRLPGATNRLQILEIRDPSANDALPSILTALRGVSTIVHAASFSTHDGKLSKHSTARRIVDALKISLDAANTPGNIVTNFIYISSEMTVFDPSLYKHIQQDETIHLTELNWYDCSKQSRELSQPFPYAYTVAEMRLWAKVSRRTLPFSVCSVIPSFLLGPILTPRHIHSSPFISFFKQTASGSLYEIPNFPTPIVDVRDVAISVAALSDHHYQYRHYQNQDMRRQEIGGRILLSANSMTAFELISHAKSEFPYYPWTEVKTGTRKKRLSLNSRSKRQRAFNCTGIPSHRFLFGAVKGESEAVKMFKEYEFTTKERLGKRYSFSDVRARNELGIRFRPFRETIGDTLKSLHEFGALPEMEHPKAEPSSESSSSTLGNVNGNHRS